MITSPKDIYAKAAKEKGLDPELVESVGNVVFEHLRSSLNDPDAICYELPQIGIFTLKFKKFEEYFQFLLKHIDEHSEEHFQKKKKAHNEIIEFKKQKKEKRKERYNGLGEKNNLD